MREFCLLRDTLGWGVLWLANCILDRPTKLSTFLKKNGWEQVNWWMWRRPMYENGMGYCYKCELLAALYEQVPKTPRNYWVMTELFVLLHGSDVCDIKGGQTET